MYKVVIMIDWLFTWLTVKVDEPLWLTKLFTRLTFKISSNFSLHFTRFFTKLIRLLTWLTLRWIKVLIFNNSLMIKLWKKKFSPKWQCTSLNYRYIFLHTILITIFVGIGDTHTHTHIYIYIYIYIYIHIFKWEK